MTAQFYPGGAGSLAYVAKLTAADVPVVPAGGTCIWADWPGWTFPGPPWPPGCPITVADLTCECIAPGTVYWCLPTLTIESKVLINALPATSLIGQVLRLSATKSPSATVVTLSKTVGGVAANYLDYLISNYAGTDVGFLELVTPTLVIGDVGKTITWTAKVMSTTPQASGTDTTEVLGGCPIC